MGIKADLLFRTADDVIKVKHRFKYQTWERIHLIEG